MPYMDKLTSYLQPILLMLACINVTHVKAFLSPSKQFFCIYKVLCKQYNFQMVNFLEPVQWFHVHLAKRLLRRKSVGEKTKVLTCKIPFYLNSESFLWVSLSSFFFSPENQAWRWVWFIMFEFHYCYCKSVSNFRSLKIWFTPAVSLASLSVQLVVNTC